MLTAIWYVTSFRDSIRVTVPVWAEIADKTKAITNHHHASPLILVNTQLAYTGISPFHHFSPALLTNLQFAIKLQEKANKEYPGLFKPIILRNSRYNQHLGKAACIIEVGATGNKLEQCLNSMKYLSKIINEI